MKLQPLITALLVCAAPLAQAMTIDAKALARFDRSYVVCETKFPAMKGQRDEAYLSLWRVKPDQRAKAELTTARKTASYRSERALLEKNGADAATPAASSPIEQQCQALGAEAQGNKKARR